VPQELMERMRKRKCFADKDLEELPTLKCEQDDVKLVMEKKFQQNLFNFLIEQQLKQYTSSNNIRINTSSINEQQQQQQQQEFKFQNEFLESNYLKNDESQPSIDYSTLFAYLMNGQVSQTLQQLTVQQNFDKQQKNSIKPQNKITNFSVEALLSI
jgi:hypothetical protein